jgi:hypothetical protein
MSGIKLDTRKLLGFKIIAAGESAAVQSPKIGGKLCAVMAENTMRAAAGGAAIGNEVPVN